MIINRFLQSERTRIALGIKCKHGIILITIRTVRVLMYVKNLVVHLIAESSKFSKIMSCFVGDSMSLFRYVTDIDVYQICYQNIT